MKPSILGSLGAVLGGISLTLIGVTLLDVVVYQLLGGTHEHTAIAFAVISVILIVSSIFDRHPGWLRIMLLMPAFVLAWGIVARIIL